MKIEANLVTSFFLSLIHGTGDFETPPKPITLESEAVGGICRGIEGGTSVHCDTLVEARLPEGRLERTFMEWFRITQMGPEL